MTLSAKLLAFITVASLALTGLFSAANNSPTISSLPQSQVVLAATDVPTPTAPPIPASKILTGGTHAFQTFNNCGPAALSMSLSYYGINHSQGSLGDILRPYQVASGDNDDKSVTLSEIALLAESFGLTPYHRPMGDIETIKNLIAQDLPVIARTWTEKDSDIGHYRVIKGYDETKGMLMQDDSLQGKDKKYKYADFNELWKKFNYEYLVLVPQDKVESVEKILGENIDSNVAWQKAVVNSLRDLAKDPEDIHAQFNLSVAYYNVGELEKSVQIFENVEAKLPFRTLWYQTEPINAYAELGNKDRVFQITDNILENGNRAFSELYQIRGEMLLAAGNVNEARAEFQSAVRYNSNFQPAIDSLARL